MSSPTVSPASDRSALHTTLEKARESEAQLTEKAQRFKNRLPDISNELAVAMVDADEKRINQLRSERASIEGELRDIEAAQNIAHQRVAFAVKALALAEIETLHAELVTEVDAFLAKTEELRRCAAELRHSQRNYHERFSECGFAEPLGHPMMWRAVFERLGSVPEMIFHRLEGVSGTIAPAV
jgi:hypothetical protein